MSRFCPEDTTPLEPRTLRGLPLDVCSTCAGIFFDEGEIAQLHADGASALEEVEESVAPEGLTFIDSPVPKRCPGCNGKMYPYFYRYSSTVRLDGCEQCGGVWVQDGELAKIAEHLKVPPSTFGGIPSARRAAEGRNTSCRSRNEAARRHADLFSRFIGGFGS